MNELVLTVIVYLAISMVVASIIAWMCKDIDRVFVGSEKEMPELKKESLESIERLKQEHIENPNELETDVVKIMRKKIGESDWEIIQTTDVGKVTVNGEVLCDFCDYANKKVYLYDKACWEPYREKHSLRHGLIQAYAREYSGSTEEFLTEQEIKNVWWGGTKENIEHFMTYEWNIVSGRGETQGWFAKQGM